MMSNTDFAIVHCSFHEFKNRMFQCIFTIPPQLGKACQGVEPWSRPFRLISMLTSIVLHDGLVEEGKTPSLAPDALPYRANWTESLLIWLPFLGTVAARMLLRFGNIPDSALSFLLQSFFFFETHVGKSLEA